MIGIYKENEWKRLRNGKGGGNTETEQEFTIQK